MAIGRGFGVALAGMNGTFYEAIARLPLGVAVSIEFLGPLILAAVLSRRRTDLVWVGLALAAMVLLGVESMTEAAGLDPLGVLFAVIAGAFWLCTFSPVRVWGNEFRAPADWRWHWSSRRCASCRSAWVA